MDDDVLDTWNNTILWLIFTVSEVFPLTQKILVLQRGFSLEWLSKKLSNWWCFAWGSVCCVSYLMFWILVQTGFHGSGAGFGLKQSYNFWLKSLPLQICCPHSPCVSPSLSICHSLSALLSVLLAHREMLPHFLDTIWKKIGVQKCSPIILFHLCLFFFFETACAHQQYVFLTLFVTVNITRHRGRSQQKCWMYWGRCFVLILPQSYKQAFSVKIHPSPSSSVLL